jgi:AraC family transcriptional regulator
MLPAAPGDFGCNRDGSLRTDFCCYCFPNGKFTGDMTPAEKTEHFIRLLDRAERAGSRTFAGNELALRMRVRLPALKRWQARESAHREYFKAMNAAVNHISEHLHEPVSLHSLTKVVHISGFHFHRIFKTMLGECPGRYIRRLRMEKVASRLAETKQTLMEIAEQTGYQSPQALSKAFHKYYGATPSEFRRHPQDARIHAGRTENVFIEPHLREVGPKTVIATRVVNPFRNPDAGRTAWQRIIRYMNVNGIPDPTHEYIFLMRDFSTLARPEQGCMHVGIACAGGRKPGGIFERQTVDGGLYAVFPFRGTCENLEMLYCYIYRHWMPNNPYELRSMASFEKYLRTPAGMSAGEVVAEVYIPVVSKRP